MRNVKRLLILLAIIGITLLTITAVAQTISGDVKLSNGVIFTIVGVIVLGWVISSFSKHRISFTRIYLVFLFSLLFVLIASAYLDVNSPADIKDSIVRSFTIERGKFRSTVDLVVQRTELKFVDITETAQGNLQETVKEPKETTTYVRVGQAILIGADGHYITLHNNPNAVNPSWAQLETFLWNDDTDSLRYDFASFVCADFAERLYNSAEKTGVRAAYVVIQLGPSSYFPVSGGHALNAFETTDRGLVFIDCTSSNQGVNADKVVTVEVGKDYVPRSIFPEPGWSDVWGDMGKVLEIETIQW